MSNLCSSLEAEHRVIEKVLAALSREAHRIESGGAVDASFFTEAIAFIREFADGLHHQKEEQALFPQMVEAGVPGEGGPIGVMLFEHQQGRAFVGVMESSLPAASGGDARAQKELTNAALDYVELLRAHIMKEDEVLFPMADRLFDDKRKGLIRASFSEAERADPERDEANRQWAMRLSDAR